MLVPSLGLPWTQLTQAGVHERWDRGGGVPEHHQERELDTSKIKTYSSAQQVSRLSRVLVFGTVSLCKALLRYGPLCDTDLQSCVIV